jgi:hypothetical protein
MKVAFLATDAPRRDRQSVRADDFDARRMSLFSRSGSAYSRRQGDCSKPSTER